MRVLRGSRLAVLLVVLAGRPAFGHALGAECKLRGDRVEVEAYYDDDTAARGARVTVLDEGKKPVAEGRTDREGRWSFPAPKAGTYRVVVDAGEGHRTTVRVTVPPPDQRPAGPPAERPGAVPISEGPDREEFTRFPWQRGALGVGIIGGAGLALWVLLRRRRAAPTGRTGPDRRVARGR